MRIEALVLAAMPWLVVGCQQPKIQPQPSTEPPATTKDWRSGSCSASIPAFLKGKQKAYEEILKRVAEYGEKAWFAKHPANAEWSLALGISKAMGSEASTTRDLATTTVITRYRGVEKALALLAHAASGDGPELREFMDALDRKSDQERVVISEYLLQGDKAFVFCSGAEPMTYNEILAWMKNKLASETAPAPKP